MKSSLLITIISYMLIINVAFCIKCRESFCKAGCYYKNKGFDYGYCENGACKCVQPEIYYFDGKDHNVDKYSISMSSTSNAMNENKMFTEEIWKKIVTIITEKYPFLQENELNNLKSLLINNQIDINDFYTKLINNNKSLYNVLNDIKIKKPELSNVFNGFLNNISSRSQTIKKKISMSSTPNTMNENKMFTEETWKKIVTIITEKYPFLQENELNNLKSLIINNQIDINDFYTKLINNNKSLYNVLNEIKIKKPELSNVFNDFLYNISSRSQTIIKKNVDTPKYEQSLKNKRSIDTNNVNNQNSDGNVYILLNGRTKNKQPSSSEEYYFEEIETTVEDNSEDLKNN